MTKIEKLQAQREIYETKAQEAIKLHDFTEAAKYLGLVSLYNHKIITEVYKQAMGQFPFGGPE